ncbi:MAG TPA: hypothetical protein PKA60_01690 [Candidatus Paceibacterota bacterium]|nr:hypothetical protein [Candidatus Paceibacterota bacterium]
MGIFRAIGLGLVIIILSFLMPEVFKAFENVLLTFFRIIDILLVAVSDSSTNGSLMPATSMMPQVPISR